MAPNDKKPQYPQPGVHQPSRFFPSPKPDGSGAKRSGAGPGPTGPVRDYPRPGAHQEGISLMQRIRNAVSMRSLFVFSVAYSVLTGEFGRSVEAGSTGVRRAMSDSALMEGTAPFSTTSQSETPLQRGVDIVGGVVGNFGLQLGIGVLLGAARGAGEGLGRYEPCHSTVEFGLGSVPALPANVLAGVFGAVSGAVQGSYNPSEAAKIAHHCSQIPGGWDHLAPESGTPTRPKGSTPRGYSQ